MKTFSFSYLSGTVFFFAFYVISLPAVKAQLLQLPDGGRNLKCSAGRVVGITDIQIRWNAPGVKGREGKIWGTDVAHFGTVVLGYGSDMASPWRAGADECTTMSFSTDVTINGKPLPAGQYAFFIEVHPDSCILVFNSNTAAWGSYFYRKDLDVLRVIAYPQKNQPVSRERLDYTFSNHSDRSVEIALEWEYWRIPFTVEVDLIKETLASVRRQMSGAMGFDPPSLTAAAQWCLGHQINLEEALRWSQSATDPSLGGVRSFTALSTHADLLKLLHRDDEAKKYLAEAMENGTAIELHRYGRMLLAENKTAEAIAVFEKNYEKHKGAWPTHVGMMRGYSALGNLQKALEHGRQALQQAPDEINRKSLQQAIETLQQGKSL